MTVGTQLLMVMTETTGAAPAADEIGYGAAEVAFWYGDGAAETTGAEVAITG